MCQLEAIMADTDIYIRHLKTQKNKPVSNTLTQTSKYAIKGHYN